MEKSPQRSSARSSPAPADRKSTKKAAKSTGRKRIGLAVPQDVHESLLDVVDRRHFNLNDTLIQAIKLLVQIDEQIKQGAKVYVVSRGGERSSLVVPWDVGPIFRKEPSASTPAPRREYPRSRKVRASRTRRFIDTTSGARAAAAR